MAINQVHSQLEQLHDDRRLMLFDLALGGHHGNYIRHLVEYWYAEKLPGQLNIVVLPEFFNVHRDVVELISQLSTSTIHIIAITPDEASVATRGLKATRFWRNFHEWKLLSHYAVRLESTQVLLMYFDTYRLPMALGWPAPCRLAGIYFRPTFHYQALSGSNLSRSQKFQQWRETIILSRVLQHRQLDSLFCLDPFAVKQFDRFQSSVKVTHLPDPVAPQPASDFTIAELKAQLAIEPGRTIFLLFGALDGRKGIYQLLDALTQLTPQVNQHICLLLVGATNATEKAEIRQKIAALVKVQPIQILERYEFVPEAAVNAYFQISDIVLAPYQQHVGMSGILLLAAAAGKPVLSSNYGLMGELVRQYRLGLAVDSTSSSHLATALEFCLTHGETQWSDQAGMQRFVEQNSVQHYTKVIFDSLLEREKTQPHYSVSTAIEKEFHS